jgi:hypothetical protein
MTPEEHDEQLASTEPVDSLPGSVSAPPRHPLNNVRNGLTSRTAGWVVAAILAVAVIALSVTASRTPSEAGPFLALRTPAQVRVGQIRPFPGGPITRVCLPWPAVLPGRAGSGQRAAGWFCGANC